MADEILKRCCACKQHKDRSCFSKDVSRKDSLYPRCRECHKGVMVKFRVDNPEAAKASSAKWQKANPEIVKAKKERFLARNPGYEAKRAAEWRERNPEKSREVSTRAAAKRRMRLDVQMHDRIGNSLRGWLKKKDVPKGSKTFDLLGYGLPDLVAHIEKQFLPGMSWDNFGEWHIDHVQPLASFEIKAEDDPELLAAWGLPNLRPLWAIDNLKKHAKRLFLL